MHINIDPITVAIYSAALVISIGLHEFGHFFFFRLAKVDVVDFSLGFGKKFFNYGIFNLRVIPLGGFVKTNYWQCKKLRITNPTLYFFAMAGGLIVNLGLGFASLYCLYHFYGCEQTISIKQLLLHDFLHGSEK
jgi:hypothetical protein